MSIKKATVNPSTTSEQEDKPIGFGSYGVVWDVKDPRTGKRVALKKITDVFDSPISAIMVFREIRMLCTFKHDNVLAALEVMQPPPLDRFEEVYIMTDLLHTNLHRLIYSDLPLTAEQIHIFMYQIMRGLKYIHSAKVIHRDIKPGNLLIYNNCLLKICDFGMSRTEVTDKSKKMSLDVVTHCYRAPEIFLGTRHYTGAIDVWAAACVFAELLGRKALFSSPSEINQINRMIDLLGTPAKSDIDYATQLMKNLVSRSPWKPPKISTLHDLSPNATVNAVDLLSRMLTFNPTKRISAAAAMEHPYMVRGRKLYHSMLCRCCGPPFGRTTNFEPVATTIFDDRWEEEITSVEVAKIKMHQYIMERQVPGRKPLYINPEAMIFQKY